MAGDDLFGKSPSGPVTTDRYGGAVWGGNADAAENDVSRYRAMGEAAANRPGVMIDFANANRGINAAYEDHYNMLGSRDRQLAASNMLGSAAAGQAPSRAAILSDAAISQGARGQLQAMAGAHGSLGSAAASRAAIGGAGQFYTQNAGQAANARAAEIASASNAYGSSLAGLRAGDYAGASGMSRLAALQAGMSQSQGDMDFRQREMNQAYQQAMENQAFGVRNAALNAGLRSKARDLGVQQFGYENQQFENELQKKWMSAMIGGATSMGSAMIANGGGGGSPSGMSPPSGPSQSGNSYGDIYRSDPYGPSNSYGDVYGPNYGGGYDPNFRGNF